MKYKCHYCGEYLKPGIQFTLECECGNCSLGFDRSGEINNFQLTFFEKGHDIFLVKDKWSENVFYGKGRSISKPYMQQIVLQIPIKLNINEEGIPQAYSLWEKLNKLVIFS